MSLLVLQHGEERLLIQRPETYKELNDFIRANLGSLGIDSFSDSFLYTLSIKPNWSSHELKLHKSAYPHLPDASTIMIIHAGERAPGFDESEVESEVESESDV